jgi:subtilase family serine protease
VNGLCSSPFSTCVGGTQFDDKTDPSAYWSATTNPGDQSSVLGVITEVVWNESGLESGGSGLWASGGGASTHFLKPTWQSAPDVPSGKNTDHRYVPDVSLTAALHDGYLVYSSDNTTSTRQLLIFGGTSASAPSFAGLTALIRQKTGYRQGNINPRLYKLATLQSNGGPAYFRRITSGNNSVPGRTGFSASKSKPGFNLATGLGSVDGDVLINHWTDELSAAVTTLTSSAATASVGSTVTFTATVSGASPIGTVQFKNGSGDLGPDNVVRLVDGVASYPTNALAVGSHSITAVYSGDANNAGSTSGVLTQTVAPAASTTSLSTSTATLTEGQTLNLTATVSGYAPNGSVQFKDGGVDLGGTVTLVDGSASYATNTLIVGSHSITAVYSGDANNAGSTSAVASVSVAAVAGPSGGVGGGATSADIPTLPQWGLILLGCVLLGVAHRQRPRTARRA